MSYKRIVVKIGTSTTTGGTQFLDMPRLIDTVRQISQLKSNGVQVTLVSSGAVAAGREQLNFPHLSKHIPGKQILASIGQPRLMSIYIDLFRMYGCVASQVLLTRNDIVNRRSYLNARNTIEGLLDLGVVPIINENDTVTTEEIKLGDNDTMSAYAAGMVGADLLILLTDQDGLFSADPHEDPSAELIKIIETPEIPESIWEAASGSKTGLGTGGMATKVHAADIARRMGTTIKIVNGSIADVLIRLVNGEAIGTTFTPVNTVLESRKRYLLGGFRSNESAIIVDKGAAGALKAGKSLLPAGVKTIHGEFERGDTVKILTTDNCEAAIGVVNYASADIQKIAGHKAADIETLLGYTFGDEIIHRDFMIAD